MVSVGLATHTKSHIAYHAHQGVEPLYLQN